MSQAVAAALPRKRLFIRSWGCQMNVYDSGRMADVLAPLGYAPAAAPDGGRHGHPQHLPHPREGRARSCSPSSAGCAPLKRAREAAGGRMVLAVAGCVAQAEGAEITARAPWVDIVLGPQTYHRLPEMVARAEPRRGRRGRDRLPGGGQVRPPAGGTAAPQGVTAFLTVQEGCDKFCSFCVVPYTRGAEYSRPAAAVLAEARRLVARGAREITLLGQNVNAYHGDAPAAAAPGASGGCCARWRRSPASLRLRYTTSHPRDMDDALIAAHRDLPAADAVPAPARAVGQRPGAGGDEPRPHRGRLTCGWSNGCARRGRTSPCPPTSSSATPARRAADFEATLALVREVGFAQAFSFKYSPRPGTPAAARATSGAGGREGRAAAGAAGPAAGPAGARSTARCVGLTMPVLFTGPGRHHGPGGGPFALAAARCTFPARCVARSGGSRPSCSRAHPNSLSGRWRPGRRSTPSPPVREEPAPA